jgi:hypothetical protein
MTSMYDVDSSTPALLNNIREAADKYKQFIIFLGFTKKEKNALLANFNLIFRMYFC